MKHSTVLKTVAEIDALQAYFLFSCKDYKNLYSTTYLICQANLFATPKGVATHS